MIFQGFRGTINNNYFATRILIHQVILASKELGQSTNHYYTHVLGLGHTIFDMCVYSKMLIIPHIYTTSLIEAGPHCIGRLHLY